MVLHLLGKKSWNVYNAANIARVRRDEAEAAAREEAEEERMRDEDAKRRLAILRGEIPHPIEAPPTETPGDDLRAGEGDAARPHKERKTRKLAGEDATDFELRVAKDQISKDTALWAPRAASSAPLIGRDGHLDLIGDDGARRRAEGNEEAEREVARRKREYEDQFTMRLANAAGKFGTTDPWYTATGEQPNRLDAPAKDVWGNDDPRRPEREAKRLTSNDPLAMMKSGAARVREVNKARAAVQLEREEELRRLKREDRRRERHERREGRSGERKQERKRERSRSQEGERKRPREGERRSSGRSERRESDRRRRRSHSPERDRSRGEDRRRH